MRVEPLSKGFSCECGRFNEYTEYEYIHWTSHIYYICGCGREYELLYGVAKMKRKSAKTKGRVGQTEVVNLIETYMGFNDDQIRSNPASVTGEDIILSESAREKFPLSIEVKRVEKLNIFTAFKQAISNAGNYMPLLVHRRNNEEWLVTFRFRDFLSILYGYTYQLSFRDLDIKDTRAKDET